MLQERVFKPGEIVAYQSKRSGMNKRYKVFFEDRVSKLRLEIESKKMSTETNTGKKQTEIGSLMAVMKDTVHIKKQVISNSNSGLYSKRDGESIDPYVTLRHQTSKNSKDVPHFGKQTNTAQD